MPVVKRIKGRKAMAIGGSKRKGRKSIENVHAEKAIVPYLCNDILFNIFSRIPADLLHKNIRYQKKDWLNVLSVSSFNNANLLRSKTGIIFINNHLDGEHTLVRFMEFEEGLEIKIREINMFKAYMRIISSCNGLILAREGMKRFPLPSIINPVTKEITRIPPCEHDCYWHHLVFIPSTKEYKVVDLFHDKSNDATGLHIRSIGGDWCDSYSFIGLLKPYESIHDESMEANMFWNQRIFIDGILYVNTGSENIMSFDLCNGSLGCLKLPASVDKVRLTQRGGILSFIARDGCCCGSSCHHSLGSIWDLKDAHTGEWEKTIVISPLPHHMDTKCFSWYQLVGSLNDGMVFVFIEGYRVLAYDATRREWKLTMKTEFINYLRDCSTHVNSLVSVI